MRSALRSIVAAALLFAVAAPAAQAQSTPSGIRYAYDMYYPTFYSWEVSYETDYIAYYSNSMLLNDVLAFQPGVWGSTRMQSTCSGSVCVTTLPDYSSYYSYPTDIALDPLTTVYPIGERDGISMAAAELEMVDTDYKGFGGWAEYSAFVVEGWDSYLDPSIIGSYSFGWSPYTNPPVNYYGFGGTWSGFMVGADVSNNWTRGNAIMGNADIHFDTYSGYPSVDVAFTNVRNLEQATLLASMYWYDIPTYSGSFSRGYDGNSIQGRFYGPRHEEVGGVFERNQILGAFGATKN